AAAPPPPVMQAPLPDRMSGMAGMAPVPTPPAAIPVALLLPLSGQHAGTGNALLNAAQLAVFEVADKSFTLVPIDTKGTPEGAAAAAQQAIAQGSRLILGPLFSAEVKASAPVAQSGGVQVVAFTNDRGAAGNGTYVLGFLPRSQVERVVAYARQQGASRFAALAPGNDFGRAMVDALKDVVAAQQLSLTGVEYYEPGANDVSGVVKRLTRVDPRNQKGQAGGAQNPGFDALLLPDEGQRLRNVASLLSYYQPDTAPARMLGTVRWDDPRLGSEPALVGGWYPAPSAETHADFEKRYQAAFGGGKPPAITSLAYDATALAAVLAKQPMPDFSPNALTNRSGFAGVDGIFRLLPDGTSERGLAVMEVQKSGPREISPAPQSFEAAGY
ncbi:MAG: penicillin-binding protein activator, partial [Rhodospirillales bacterium]|nr:penicillin-binding protein activator [Rhodospirillales bacterium]